MQGLGLLEGVARPLLVGLVGLRRRRVLVLLGGRGLGRAHLGVPARVLLSAVQDHHVILLLVVLLRQLLQEGGLIKLHLLRHLLSGGRLGRRNLGGPRHRHPGLLKLVLSDLEHLLQILQALLQSLRPRRYPAAAPRATDHATSLLSMRGRGRSRVDIKVGGLRVELLSRGEVAARLVWLLRGLPRLVIVVVVMVVVRVR